MEIETYEVTECGTSGPEPEAEALALIEELGLEGQKSLVRGDAADAALIPYARMTAEESSVYALLYPTKSEPHDYRAGPIPLRVLQVIAHARTLFDRLWIWSPKERDPDPVLVGVINTKMGDERYLLARWGDALEPFDVLRDRCIAKTRERCVAKARQVVAECEAFIAAPDASVLRIVSGEFEFKPWSN